MMNVGPRVAAPAPELRDIVYDLIVKYQSRSCGIRRRTGRTRSSCAAIKAGASIPNAPFVGPQIEAYPGQTVRMTLHNELPADLTCPVRGGSANVPHCFNETNLHAHGLWVPRRPATATTC